MTRTSADLTSRLSSSGCSTPLSEAISASIAAVAWVPSYGWFFVIGPLLAFGHGLAFPSFTSLFTRLCRAEQAGGHVHHRHHVRVRHALRADDAEHADHLAVDLVGRRHQTEVAEELVARFGTEKNLHALPVQAFVQQAQQRFERLFRSNPTPMALSTLHDGRFRDVNDAFLETYGYAREEVVGKNPRILKSSHSTKELYEIFPGGPAKKAARIAGPSPWLNCRTPSVPLSPEPCRNRTSGHGRAGSYERGRYTA